VGYLGHTDYMYSARDVTTLELLTGNLMIPNFYLTNIIKSENKDKPYQIPSGKELLRRELANKEKELVAIRDAEGKFIKYVKTQKGTNPMDSFF